MTVSNRFTTGLIRCSLFLSFLFFRAVLIQAQYANDRYHSSEVLARLKVDTCYSYTVSGKKLIPEDFTVFNKNGDDISVTDIAGESHTVYRYNEKNQLLSRSFYAKTPDSDRYEFIESDTHIYNSSAQLISSRTTDYLTGMGEYTRSDYYYSGDTLRTSEYYFNSELINKTTYKYNPKNRINTEEVINSVSGKSTSIFTYNEAGLLIAYCSLEAGGDTSISHRYRLDANGRRTDFYAYDKKGVLSQYYHYVYDNGLLLSCESYTAIKNGDLRKSEYSKTIYTYTYRKP